MGGHATRFPFSEAAPVDFMTSLGLFSNKPMFGFTASTLHKLIHSRYNYLVLRLFLSAPAGILIEVQYNMVIRKYNSVRFNE